MLMYILAVDSRSAAMVEWSELMHWMQCRGRIVIIILPIDFQDNFYYNLMRLFSTVLSRLVQNVKNVYNVNVNERLFSLFV